MIKTVKQEAGQETDELSKGNGELILVAEDDRSVCEITCSILEAYGYRVLAAKNGFDALTLYAQNIQEISVVLMDMQMPVMDGEESIRAIREINPKARIIAASGFIGKDKLAKIESTNAQAILPKPYTAGTLLKSIKEVLSPQ